VTLPLAELAPPPRIARHLRALRRIGAELRRAPTIAAVSLLLLAILLGALLAPLLAAQDPFDLASIDLGDSLRPPTWIGAFPLGADEQGRDVLSMLLYGARSSLIVSFSAGEAVFPIVIGTRPRSSPFGYGMPQPFARLLTISCHVPLTGMVWRP